MWRQIAVSGVAAAFLVLSSAGFAAPPVLEVSPTYLEFSAYEDGNNPENQIISIWRGGGNGPLNWEVTEDCNWLTVNPTSGKSMGEVDDVNVIVDISGLSAGSYNCQLTVDAGTAVNSPQIIDVNLIVIGPILELSATQFEFTAFEGGANPADQILTISNIGVGTLNWQIAEDCNWLMADPNSGSSTGEADDVNVGVDITSLTRGIYDCQLTLSDSNASNSPQIVDVDLTVIGPEIQLSATQFEFTATEGGANPNDQILGISNIGGGTLNWEITEDCNWLTAEPNSGSSTAEADDANLGVDITALTGGTYDCQLTVSDSNASNSPQIVDIDLLVHDADGRLYVPSEYPTIQAAIDAASPGDTVIIAEGTYTGTGNRDLDFGGKAIIVQSTDPEDPCVVAATIIDCNGNVADPHRGFYFHTGEDSNSIVSGLTIKNGYVYDANGGGIYCSGSSPIIENCIIRDNIAQAWNGNSSIPYGGDVHGGGIYCSSLSNSTIINTRIINNKALGGNGGIGGWDPPLISGEGGDGYGGGVYCSPDTNLTITICTIANNEAKGGNGINSSLMYSDTKGGEAYGGGIYSASNSNLRIENSSISSNKVSGSASGSDNHYGGPEDGAYGYGAGICCDTNSTVTIRDSKVNNNTVKGGRGGESMSYDGGNGGIAYGGGIYCNTNSKLTIENCTAALNTASGGKGADTFSTVPGDGGDAYGAGIYCNTNTESTITNCTNIYNQASGGSGGIRSEAPPGSDGNSYGGGIYYNAGGTKIIKDSIVRLNSPEQMAGQNCNNVSYSNIGDGTCSGGTGNIDSDPCFVSGPLGDYYLSQIVAGQAVDSPCVDAGSDTAANLGLDYLVTTRTDQWVDVGIVDMGYHYPLGMGSADIDENWHVDLFDFAILGGDWGRCSEPYDSNCIAMGLAGDIASDYYVDMKDLAVLVDCWLDCYVTEASNPSPADNQGNIWIEPVLSWSAGKGAVNHDVYFGTDYNDVNDATTASAEYMGRQDANSWDVNNYDMNGLDYDTSYYWRIDEVGAACVKEGGVWGFTTYGEPNQYIISHWKFDEGSGSTAYDSTGDNDGTLVNGPAWTVGQIDGALDFDGTNDYVTVAHDRSLDISGVTLSAWVKLNDDVNSQNIVGKTASGGDSADGGYNLIFSSSTGYSDGTFRLVFKKANGTGGTGGGNYGTNTNWDRVVSEKNNWQTDTWYHVAATWDGTTNSASLKMYVDGVPDANHTANQAAIKIAFNDLQIGRSLHTSPMNQFDGAIDDARIYDRALFAGEVWQLYQEGL